MADVIGLNSRDVRMRPERREGRGNRQARGQADVIHIELIEPADALRPIHCQRSRAAGGRRVRAKLDEQFVGDVVRGRRGLLPASGGGDDGHGDDQRGRNKAAQPDIQ